MNSSLINSEYIRWVKQQPYPFDNYLKFEGMYTNVYLPKFVNFESLTILKAHYQLASYLVGIDLCCKLEVDYTNYICNLAIYKLNSKLIQKFAIKMPASSIEPYIFHLIWLDQTGEYNPFHTKPILIFNQDKIYYA